jgi:hypothetical protein
MESESLLDTALDFEQVPNPSLASLIASAALPVRGPSPAVALTMTLPTSAQARVVQQVAG